MTRRTRGFTLLETVVAMAILALATSLSDLVRMALTAGVLGQGAAGKP